MEESMHFLGVNLWAVLISALATMVAGFLWYSPALFAKPWTILMGYDPNDKAKLAEMQKSAGPSYAMSFVASILSAFVLGKIIEVSNVNSALYGMEIGLAIWLGIVTTVQFTNALFSRQPFKLYLINTGYQAVCYLVTGAILGGWR
jgi:surface polysaccharide O-acyltransferase-like enzyme